MEIENEFIMSQDGYASIDFTLLDRPNNNIASAPEATAVLLPDEHATDVSFPSFDLLDGSGVVGSYGYAGEADDSQPLEQSRDGSEKDFYKEQAMHSGADNGVGASNVEYAEYPISQSVPKPVSSVDFFAKNQAPQQQVQQSQLNLFGSDGGEENQEFYESGQASQQSQPTGSSWWMPDNTWGANNSQRDQSQVYNWAAMTEEQRRAMRLKMGGSQNISEYPGAMYSMPQAVNSDPTPSMYSFLPTNSHQLHKMPQQADTSRMQALQSSSAGRNPQYDFQGLLEGSGYQEAGNFAQNMGLLEQQRYRAMMQEASGREQQMRMQEARNREQQLREQQLREQQLREQQLREQQLREQQQIREQQLREQQLREQQLREQQLREQQLREQQLREQQVREQQLREQQMREQQIREQHLREQQLRMQEAGSREQQLRLQGQQMQSFGKYDNQNMEASSLKVSDYDFLGGGDYTMKGQPQSEVRQQLNDGDAQLWRQQQQQQQQRQQQMPARQQPRQFNTYANNTYEDMHQRQQAQVRQRMQHQAQQQHLLAGNQNQASGNQFQAFLDEGSLQHLPQVMQQHPERVDSPQTSADGHNSFVPPNVQAANQNTAGNLMYNSQNEAGPGQGSMSYLLGQDNSFSWHQLAMKASGLDQSMHASSANSSKPGQQLNPYANAQGGTIPGFLGGMGKHPAQINRPIPRSAAAGPSPLFAMEGRPESQDHQASKAKMLFGQAMPQQQQPSQAAKHMQGFPGNSHQGNYVSGSRQASEEAQRRHQQNLRGGHVQQDGAPNVKLFAQNLTSMDPIQQQQQQQQHLMAASRSAPNILQQSSLNMTQERNSHLPGHHYQQGINQASGSFSHNASDRKQQAMWNNYEMEPEVEAPVMLPGNADPLLKNNSWSAGSEGHPVPDADNSLAFERSKMQQNVWGVHSVQPSNSQSSGDMGSGHHNTQSGSVVQQGTPKSTGGHPLASQANGGIMHQSSLQSPMLEPSELEANGRQQELQNSQDDTNWRNHSLLQASPQQSVATNASLQGFTDTDRAQSSWKSLWQGVQNSGNSSQLAETEKGPQDTLWGQNHSHVEVSNDPKARMASNGWADASGENRQAGRIEQQVMLSGSPQPAQSFHDVEGRQQLGNQGPSFQEARSQASLSDNDPSSTSQHVEQSIQNATSFPHPVDRDGNVVNSSDLAGHSSSSKESMRYANYSVEHQTAFNKGNLQNQGKVNAWTPDARPRFDETSVPVPDSSGPQEGRVQLQLSNQQAENRFSSLINARAMNAMSAYGQKNSNERPALLNGAIERSIAGGWAPDQMAANQMRIQQSNLAGRALQTSNLAGNAGKESFLPSRPESAGDEQTNYNNNMLAQRARYSGRRDVADPGRNTLELLHQSEQGGEMSEALVDQEGQAPEDGAGPAATSLAHLRPGPMGASPLQRPTPSRAEFMSREQMEPHLARNMENWPQGRNLQQDFSREDPRAYAQSQMQAQMQSQMQAQMQSQMQSQMQAQQAHNMRVARPGQMQERVAVNPAFLGANRHFPNEMSRQTAANIYKNLSEAAKIQFRQQLHQQQLANQQRAQRANAAAHLMDHSNMSSGIDPRMAAQQHMSRVGYADRPAMPAGISPDKQPAATEIAAGSPSQVDVGSSQAQQLQQAAPVGPIIKKRKEFPPLVPWRTTISQGSANLPTTSRAEMEWAAATHSNPDQERFNDAVETLDVTAMCVKRAKRRLKFTTQLMQQLVPALPCQLFKGNSLDDYKSATFVLAKFAVSEACWLSTGLTRGTSGAVAIEDSAEKSNGDVTTVQSDQQLAVVKESSSPVASKVRIQVEQKMIEFQEELSRLESAPTALRLSRDLHDLDKLVVVNRMARVHGSEFLAGLTNPTGSPRGKLGSHAAEAAAVYNPENAYPERFVAAVFVPQTIPDNLVLIPL